MEERYAEIERDNRLLLEKMSYIMRHSSLDNDNQMQYAHSLNREQRKRELQRITRENQNILGRIQAAEPTYDHLVRGRVPYRFALRPRGRRRRVARARARARVRSPPLLGVGRTREAARGLHEEHLRAPPGHQRDARVQPERARRGDDGLRAAPPGPESARRRVSPKPAAKPGRPRARGVTCTSAVRRLDPATVGLLGRGAAAPGGPWPLALQQGRRLRPSGGPAPRLPESGAARRDFLRSHSARRRRGRIQRRRSTGSQPASRSGTTARSRQNATRWALPREFRLTAASGYHHRVQGALFVLGRASAEGRGARITYLVYPGPLGLDIAQQRLVTTVLHFRARG